MNEFTRKEIKKYNVKIPKGYIIVDLEKDIPMEPGDKIFHWVKKEFYAIEWWKEHEPRNVHVSEGIIVQDITIIRPIPEPRIHVPVKPEKLRVIKNVKRLIKRQL